MPLIQKVIEENGLKVYFVMLSWWGRGDEARYTGAHLLNTLKKFQREGFCEVFLSYQEGGLKPSSLCFFCKQNGIETFLVDHYELVSKETKEIVVPKKAPGKAENLVKALKLIEEKIKREKIDLQKTLVIFVDDDYTQYHWINYFLLFAPWVLSFAKETEDEEIDRIIKLIDRVSFIKSGSPRIILPYEMQSRVVHGDIKPMNYLEVTLSLLNLASSHQRFGLDKGNEEIREIISILEKIKRKGQVYSPQTRELFLGKTLNRRMESIWREYIYRGGRVTQRLEGIFRYLSHKNRYRWLRQFTFLLHGDQGAPLDAWQEFSIFGGYALEISLLMQAICDRSFQDRKVLNVIGLPHSHQRSKELAVWHMLDGILLALDFLRVLYRDLSLRDFASLHMRYQNYPMVDRYGNILRHHPQYKELKIYPPLKTLKIQT